MPGPTLCNFLPSRSSFHFFSLLISKHLNLQLCRSHNSLSLLALPFFLWVSFYSDLPRQCSISVLYFLYFFLTLYFVHVSSDVPVTLGLFEVFFFFFFFTFLSIFVAVLCLTFFCLKFLCCFPPTLCSTCSFIHFLFLTRSFKPVDLWAELTNACPLCYSV